jgi:DNA-binding GntR family transcriptional regulator
LEPRPIASTIRDQVYQILKDEICNGYYEPGHWLQENELAQRLQVSRSPVREALRQLTRDGLVRDVPNKGVFVKEFSIQDIEEVFDLRIMMESYALLRAREDRIQENKDRLLELLDEMDRTHAAGDQKAYINTDIPFHHLLIELCGNSFLRKSYNDVYSMIKQFCIYSLIDTERFDNSMSEHRQIVSCLLAGQLEEAEKVNRLHLELTKTKVAQMLASQAHRPGEGPAPSP